MAHPQEAFGLPASCLEAGAQRLGGIDEIEVDPPVREPCERLIRERRQFIYIHRRVVLDPDDIEGPVARVTRRSHDRAVRPGLEHVTNRGVHRIAPAARAGRQFGVQVHPARHQPGARSITSATPCPDPTQTPIAP